MQRHRDMTGETFGLLTAIERLPGRYNDRVMWRCRCQCGAEVEALAHRLVSGSRKYCDRAKHGTDLSLPQHQHPVEYSVWNGMRSRCAYPSNEKGWRNYGGRGIKVCERWQRFEAFFEDMGERPGSGMSIERLDVNGDYEPGNCVWATADQQSANRRDTVWVEHQGAQRKLIDLAREAGLTQYIVRGRLKMGWSIERALQTPVRVPKPKVVRTPRPPSLQPECMRMLAKGYRPSEVMRITGAGPSTVYAARYLLEIGRPVPPPTDSTS